MKTLTPHKEQQYLVTNMEAMTDTFPGTKGITNKL